MLHSANDRLSVHQDLDCGLFSVKEAKCDLVEARGHSHHVRVVLRVPDEILGEGIDRLDFPRHSEAVSVQVAAVPHPSGGTVLSHEILIHFLLFE